MYSEVESIKADAFARGDVYRNIVDGKVKFR